MDLDVLLIDSTDISVALNNDIDQTVLLETSPNIEVELESSTDVVIDQSNVLVAFRGSLAGLIIDLWESPFNFDQYALDTLGEVFEIIYSFEMPLILRLDSSVDIDVELISE